MSQHLKYATLLLSGALALASCKKDKDEDPTPPTVNEEEVITSLEMHFHSLGEAEHKHFEFHDLDGDGGNPPVITADTLSPDSVYEVSLQLLNETVNPVDNITDEILAEAVDHQFFFQANGANLSFSYADADANGNPIGLQDTCTVGAASIGTLTVTLRHQPDKFAPGVSDGDITNAGGETDIEVTFPVVIQ